MPLDKSLRKVCVVGSGPIVIGQAAEFDYAGTQACRALREEGIEVVLINSNPATIMTDTEVADTVYLEPLTPDLVAQVLERERPDGLLPTLGGQTGLNLAVALNERGVLDRLGIRLLGTPLEAIQRAEDRELFKRAMAEIGQPVAESRIVSSMDEARSFLHDIGLPIIVRPAFTLGGTGGGIANTEEQFEDIVRRGLTNSPIKQVLLERSVAGWKEIEFEVIRDAADRCIAVCGMENIDPIGIHTGDSIVVVPPQTLTGEQYRLLKGAALDIIRSLGIEGGCNVQFALKPDSLEYYVIEVNPRVSRSSALASKATGYPIARVAAKIAMGYTLDEIGAAAEPELNHIAVKIPRWPFDKFVGGDRVLGTQMKATGEVMALEQSVEAALMKAVRSLEIGVYGLRLPGMTDWSDAEVRRRLREADDERLFVVAEALRRGVAPREIADVAAIDPYFVEIVARIIEVEKRLAALPRGAGGTAAWTDRDWALVAEAKRLGIADREIGWLTDVPQLEIRAGRKARGIVPAFRTVAAYATGKADPAPYLYSTYEGVESRPAAGEGGGAHGRTEAPGRRRPKVLVLGSGPIRIGQGIEFDYCSVHSVRALREAGCESIIINNNPETVSTDFDTSDRLYFEPLALEDVLNVIEREQPMGVVVQFGGQTAINLAKPLAEAGVNVLGTPVDAIDRAEDRERFGALLSELGIAQAEGRTATSVQEAMGIAMKLGFPLVVRPSYVLGGRAMEIVHDEQELLEYMTYAVRVSPAHPVLVDRYVPGKELDVDAVADGERVFIPGIMEHIERAGVHSGDSTTVFPPLSLTAAEVEQVVDYTRRIALELGIKGVVNIQFVLHGGRLYVLEVNPRASRTVPVLSKATGVPLVGLATRIMLGETLAEMGYGDGLLPPPPYTSVKAPVFSFEKLGRVDVYLSPEMKSTGEVLGLDPDPAHAMYKALVGAGAVIPTSGTLLITLADKDKAEGAELAAGFVEAGFQVMATRGTAAYLRERGLPVTEVHKIGAGHPDIVELIQSGAVDLLINTPTRGRVPASNGFRMRRAAVEYKVPCLTSLDTARAVLETIRAQAKGRPVTVVSLNECLAQARARAAAPGPA
ncbi:MAG: carbamoyl-phosphate synthase large subunit [Bacillota bacterium]|nr:MAG: carbamoyl-phosphate synthase large subunit [Bacillota bacterium]